MPGLSGITLNCKSLWVFCLREETCYIQWYSLLSSLYITFSPISFSPPDAEVVAALGGVVRRVVNPGACVIAGNVGLAEAGVTEIQKY